MVRLQIIRHADPDYDTDRQNGGSLTMNGKAEASALAEYLRLEEITHAYTSPMGRAKLTAKLALLEIPRFSTRYWNDVEISKSVHNSSIKSYDEKTDNNFDCNVGVEDWCRELSSWRQISHLDEFQINHPGQKPPAIWDFPAHIIRNQLQESTRGEFSVGSRPKGWKVSCPDHAFYDDLYAKFCHNADEFLSRHGIMRKDVKHDANYYLTDEVALNPERRRQNIAIFCHGGMGLTLLSHLLSIPLPLVHASMWLPPSSVTTILFDEYDTSMKGEGKLNNPITVTPRAIQIGGTNHLTAAGLSISNSKYEDGKRPAGIKHNWY